MTTANVPEVGHDYAYVPVPHRLSHPVRVTVLGPYNSHSSNVYIHHPDGTEVESGVPNSALIDAWNDRPSQDMWPGYQGEHTWAEIAEQTYAHIQEERALARRLTDLGVPRKLRRYAGRGGTSQESGEADAQLTFTHTELDYLLTLAEQGKEGSTSATQETQ